MKSDLTYSPDIFEISLSGYYIRNVCMYIMTIHTNLIVSQQVVDENST